MQCMCDKDEDENHDTGAKLEVMGWQGTCSCNLICRWPDGTSNGQGTNMCATKCCNDVSWYKENMKPDEYFHPTDPSRRCCKGPNCRESEPKPKPPKPPKGGGATAELGKCSLRCKQGDRMNCNFKSTSGANCKCIGHCYCKDSPNEKLDCQKYDDFGTDNGVVNCCSPNFNPFQFFDPKLFVKCQKCDEDSKEVTTTDKPATPAPTTPAPTTPALTPAPVTSATTTPAPVTPAPVTPATTTTTQAPRSRGNDDTSGCSVIISSLWICLSAILIFVINI